MALAEGDRKVEQGSAADTASVEALFDLAAAKQRSGDLEGARRAYVRVLDLEPFHHDALNNLGVILRAEGKNLAALAAHERALNLKPNDPGLLANLGNILRSLGRFNEALNVLHRAVSLAPKVPAVHHNLGLVLRDLGHNDDALACFERSLALWPNNRRVKLDRAVTLLAKGDYRAGFRALEARFEPQGPEREGLPPIWSGESLGTRSLLIEAEQSVGDTLQFIRFATQVKGPRVVLNCPTELCRLLGTAPGIDATLPFGEPPEGFDLRVPLLSLPRVLGTTLSSMPRRVPYLRPPIGAGFALTHPRTAKLAVGIVWTETNEEADAAPEAIGLERFFPLLSRADVAYYSLQTGARSSDLEMLGAPGLVHDLGPLLSTIDDLARVIEQLDLVVTVNSAVAHLAGALGRPVWLVLPARADWRWALEPERSPWYPTLRLFRQPKPGDWAGAFAGVARKLHALVAG